MTQTFQSEFTHNVALPELPTMAHVLDALQLAESPNANARMVAENVFSQISKRYFQEVIQNHKNTIPSFPEIQRLLRGELYDVDYSYLNIFDHKLLLHLSDKQAHVQLETTAKSAFNYMVAGFSGAKVYLIDALFTEMSYHGNDKWSFRWRQKYAL